MDRLRRYARQKLPDADDDVIKLTVAALSVYRLGLTDMHVREHVLRLWIMEGEDHMRCHQGDIYFCRNGAFAVHRGIPPQATLSRCKKFILVLEGFFRSVRPRRMQNDDQVLEELSILCENFKSTALRSCKAKKAKIARSTSRAAAAEEPADEDQGSDATTHVGSTPVSVILADALSRGGYSMQKALLEDKTFRLVVEWCDMP